jgi:hypothetical protein
MSFGISVVNTGGVVVIDNDYSNYAVFAEGTIASGSAPLTTIYPDELIFYTIDTNGGEASFAIFENIWYASGAFRYIRVRPLSSVAPGPESYGIRVFDSQNKTVFDSSSKYIKPVGMYSYLPFGGTTNYTLPAPSAGKKLWFSGQVFKFIEVQDTGSNSGDAYCTGLIRNSQTSWSMSGQFISSGPPATFGNSHASFKFLVIEA